MEYRHDNKLFLKKLNAIGGMIFTFKNVYMKENPFDYEYIKKNSTYIVLKSGGTELFETLSGRGYSIYALFYACLKDYQLIEYIEKNNKLSQVVDLFNVELPFDSVIFILKSFKSIIPLTPI